MSETNINRILLPEGTSYNLTAPEEDAIDIAVKDHEDIVKAKKEILKVQQIAEIMKQQRKQRRLKLFKALDVAIWVTLVVEIGILYFVVR